MALVGGVGGWYWCRCLGGVGVCVLFVDGVGRCVCTWVVLVGGFGSRLVGGVGSLCWQVALVGG